MVDYILIRTLVTKQISEKPYIEGEVLVAFRDEYNNCMRLKEDEVTFFKEDEYELVIDDRSYDQLLYCI